MNSCVINLIFLPLQTKSRAPTHISVYVVLQSHSGGENNDEVELVEELKFNELLGTHLRSSCSDTVLKSVIVFNVSADPRFAITDRKIVNCLIMHYNSLAI